MLALYRRSGRRKPRELTDELLWLMDHHRQMLRADPILSILIAQGYQWDLMAGLVTIKTLQFRYGHELPPDI